MARHSPSGIPSRRLGDGHCCWSVTLAATTRAAGSLLTAMQVEAMAKSVLCVPPAIKARLIKAVWVLA